MEIAFGARLARLGADVCTVVGWALAVLLSLDVPTVTQVERANHARFAIYGVMALCLLALVIRHILEDRAEKAVRARQGTAADQADRDRRLIQQMHTRIEALVAADAMRTPGISADFDTTQAKVETLLLAEELYEYIDHYRAGDDRNETELVRDVEYLYGPSIRKSRGELADRRLTDSMLDRFAHKQEDAASVEMTAQTLERLANQLPEDPTFPSGRDSSISSLTAMERYRAFVDGKLGAIKAVLGEEAARTYLQQTSVEHTKRWKNPQPR